MPSSKSSDTQSIGSAVIGVPTGCEKKDLQVLESAAKALESDITKLLAKNEGLVKLIAEKATLQQGAGESTRADFQQIETKIAAEISQFTDKLADINQLSTKVAMLSGSAKIDFSVLSRLKEELNQAIQKLNIKNKELRAAQTARKQAHAAPSTDTPHKRPRR